MPAFSFQMISLNTRNLCCALEIVLYGGYGRRFRDNNDDALASNTSYLRHVHRSVSRRFILLFYIDCFHDLDVLTLRPRTSLAYCTRVPPLYNQWPPGLLPGARIIRQS